MRANAIDLAVDIPSAQNLFESLKDKFFKQSLNALSKGLPEPMDGVCLIHTEMNLGELERSVGAIGNKIKEQLREKPWSDPVPPEGVLHTLNINNFENRICQGLKELRQSDFVGVPSMFSPQELKTVQGFERLAAGLKEIGKQ